MVRYWRRLLPLHIRLEGSANGFIDMIVLLRLFLINLFCALFLIQTGDNGALPYFIVFFSGSLWLEMTENKKVKMTCLACFLFSIFTFGKAILFFSPALLISDFGIVEEENDLQIPPVFDAEQTFFKAIILCCVFIGLNFLFFIFAAVIFFYTIEKERYGLIAKHYATLQDSLTERTLQNEAQKRQLQNEALKNSEAAVLAERNRISGELHNSIGHTISAAILQVNALKYIAVQKEVKTNLDILQSSLETGLTEIRTCLHNLHNDSFDLQTGIEKLIDSAAQRLNIRLTCKTETMPYILKYDILSAIKECLSNTLKHSDATAMTIGILEHPAFYSVSVQDNGTGCAFVEPCMKGIGLTVLSEIAARNNGSIHFYSKGGFKVHITFPKERRTNR